MKEFTKADLRLMRVALANAMTSIEEEFGVGITVGNITYSSDEATIKLVAVPTGSGGQSFEEVRFNQHCNEFGLKPEDRLKEFTTLRGGTYQIITIDPKKRKYPIICLKVGTKSRYKMTVDQVRWGLKLKGESV